MHKSIIINTIKKSSRQNYAPVQNKCFNFKNGLNFPSETASFQAIKEMLEEGLWNYPSAYYVADDIMNILSFTTQPYIILSSI